MNLIKVILLLFLVLKSSGGFALPIPCCDQPTEPTELTASHDDDNQQDDESDCCGGINCECLCCSHVFTMEDPYDLLVQPPDTTLSHHAQYLSRLSRIHSNALWQPPKYS